MIFLMENHILSQIDFSQSNLIFSTGNVTKGTGLMFGPDERLYVINLDGTIDILSIERNGPKDYVVTNAEKLLDVKNIPNHNDDGSMNSLNIREATSLYVGGTSTNPVIYVSSSDSRTGGPTGDTDLDTNSGVITRLSWDGSAWEVVDLVRGLPRSEENHATHGLELATINGTNYLLVCSGGFTNAGSPSKNFAWTTEYALSAAVLAVNLDELNAMSIQTDPLSGRKFIYDLPTLDDPTRPNANGITDPDDPAYDGIDEGDPWGGNDGLNQAMVVMNGPVKMFSPGYRNTYDLTVTEEGKVYITENGANGGWGGLPVNEGTDAVNNNYDDSEPGSSTFIDGEKVNNKDHLILVTTNLDDYNFGSFYAGHPCPVRANPLGAGLYTNPSPLSTDGAIFRTQLYDPDGSRAGSTTDPNLALPANWPPVPTELANPVEGDYRGPGDINPDGPIDEIVTLWGNNTNGIDEYTASNFGGAMKGDLIAGSSTKVLKRVELNPDGSLKNLTESFQSNLSGNPLGITCNGDNDPFPGTIWVATFNNKIAVLEPNESSVCILPDDPNYDPNSDSDEDGYTNQDELDNKLVGESEEAVICNGGRQPNDFDKEAGGALVSDLNDQDDDSDGILDKDDPFQLGDPLSTGNDAFDLPVFNDLFSDNSELKGFLGLGFTGLMNNGQENPNWLNWIDRTNDPNDPNPNDILGGAVGAMTMQMTAGTALGVANDQEKAFQYGVNVDASIGTSVVEGSMLNFNDPLQLYGELSPANGKLGIFLGDGTQSNFLAILLSKSGVEFVQEVDDNTQAPIQVDIAIDQRPNLNAKFKFEIDHSSGSVNAFYAFDGGAFNLIGSLIAGGSVLNAIQSSDQPLAVGLIGSSNEEGFELEGTWDYLDVLQVETTAFTWTDQTDDENYTARHECSFVQAGKHFFLLGGRENAQTLEVYDIESKTWSPKPNSIPKEFNHFQAVSYQGLIWVIGAFQTNDFPTETPADYVWAYDPVKEEWIQGPAIPDDRKRGATGLVMYEDEFYVICGNKDGHNGQYVNLFDKYDPTTGIWTSLPDAPHARDHFHAAVIGDKLYVAGGRLSGGPGGIFAPFVAEVDVYDFTSGTWSTLPAASNLPTPRAGTATVAFENELYVIGGEGNGQAYNTTEVLDPVTNSWKEIAALNFARHGTQAIASGGAIYIAAGSPQQGGGKQKNMEFLGLDNPSIETLIASQLSSEPQVIVPVGQTQSVSLESTNGNMGIFLTDLQLTGVNASEFELVEEVNIGLLKPGEQLEINIQHNGVNGEESADLVISYGNGQTKIIEITSQAAGSLPPITIDPISDQVSNNGELINLVVLPQGGSDNESFSFEASGLPAGLEIEPTTGLIFGTIDMDASSNSPYTPIITVDKPSSDPAEISFNWTVNNIDISPPNAPVQLAPIPGDGEVSLNWESVAGATAYTIKYGNASGNHPNSKQVGNVTSYTLTGLTSGIDYFFVVSASNSEGEGANSNEQATIPLGPTNSELVIERGIATGVGSDFITISLQKNFTNPVIITTPILPTTATPFFVTRITNVTGNSFELKVQNPGGSSIGGATVQYLVVEAGTYTVEEHGVKMEARTLTSNTTVGYENWSAFQEVNYYQSYANPIVLGQVMSNNDADWSVFLATSEDRRSPPSANVLRIGKHVGEDSDIMREDELIGFIAIEAGSGQIGGIEYEAGLGPNTIQGASNSANGYTYAHSLPNATGAVLSSAGMNGNDGGWPILLDPVESSGITLLIAEDQLKDAERGHISEEVAYLITGEEEQIPSMPNSIPLLRIRAAGETIPALDEPNPDWIGIASKVAMNYQGTFDGIDFQLNIGTLYHSAITSFHASVPDYVPTALFDVERWDSPQAPEMQWAIGNLENGDYLVRLYLGEGWFGAVEAGKRLFDIKIEDVLVEDDLDMSATYGYKVGFMKEYPVTLVDGEINILFEHIVQNPTIRGIEILRANMPVKRIRKKEGMAEVTISQSFGSISGKVGVIHAYPNPLDIDLLTVQFAENVHSNVDYAVYNLEGRLIKTSKIFTDGDQLQIDFKDHHLPTGGYLLKLRGEMIESKSVMFIKR